MCRRISCERCGKPTYAGCGAHIEQVLAGVPPAERCACRATEAGEPAGAQDERPSWRERLFGKPRGG